MMHDQPRSIVFYIITSNNLKKKYKSINLNLIFIYKIRYNYSPVLRTPL